MTKVQGYSERWAAPEVLETGDRNTQEADVFAFGMVVVEVSPCVSLPRASGVGGLSDIVKDLHRKAPVQQVLVLTLCIKDYRR